jgi:hypothetical protein
MGGGGGTFRISRGKSKDGNLHASLTLYTAAYSILLFQCSMHSSIDNYEKVRPPKEDKSLVMAIILTRLFSKKKKESAKIEINT